MTDEKKAADRPPHGETGSDTEEVAARIEELKRERNAVILAHNYQLPAIQQIADHLGDSLALAKLAMDTDADVIIFCGVDFMAESAKVLNPEKCVVIPDKGARCPMAAMADVDDLRAFKAEHPGVPVVAYVNTTAATKTEADICCTSGNAVKVVGSLDAERVIFVPDTNLGHYVQSQLPEVEIIYWPGYCHVHHQDITPKQLTDLRSEHSKAEILVHPECPPEVIEVADYVESTSGMVRRVRESDADEFIVGTEKEMAYRLGTLFSDRTFYPVARAVCHNMKKITLPKVLRALEQLEDEVDLDDEMIEGAKDALDRMVAIGRD